MKIIIMNQLFIKNWQKQYLKYMIIFKFILIMINHNVYKYLNIPQNLKLKDNISNQQQINFFITNYIKFTQFKMMSNQKINQMEKNNYFIVFYNNYKPFSQMNITLQDIFYIY